MAVRPHHQRHSRSRAISSKERAVRIAQQGTADRLRQICGLLGKSAPRAPFRRIRTSASLPTPPPLRHPRPRSGRRHRPKARAGYRATRRTNGAGSQSALVEGLRHPALDRPHEPQVQRAHSPPRLFRYSDNSREFECSRADPVFPDRGRTTRTQHASGPPPRLRRAGARLRRNRANVRWPSRAGPTPFSRPDCRRLGCRCSCLAHRSADGCELHLRQ